MLFKVVFIYILLAYALYYMGLIVYSVYFEKDKSPLEEIKQEEEEIDVSDEDLAFSPTQIQVEKKKRRPDIGKDEEQETQSPVKMNDGFSVNEIMDLVNEKEGSPDNCRLNEIALMWDAA